MMDASVTVGLLLNRSEWILCVDELVQSQMPFGLYAGRLVQ
jgi:hypothetical protein